MIPDESERPYLLELGREVRLMRQEHGLSQQALADLVEISARQVAYIEGAQRRTRRSTLERIVRAVADDLDDAEQAEVVEVLVEMAGPALAPESPYAAKQARSRARRRRRREAAERAAIPIALEMTERALQYRGWRPETISAVLHPPPALEPAPPAVDAGPRAAAQRKRRRGI